MSAATSADRRRIRRRWPIISGGIAIALAALLGVLAVLRDGPFDLDERWMSELLEERTPWLDVPALLLDWLGGGIVGVFVVPTGLALLLVALKRPWAAFYSVTAAVLSAAVVQLLKNLLGRQRPLDILVVADFGSFPSGHVANAATLAVTFIIIFGLSRRRWWVWMLGIVYIVTMALARTYLGAHWITDTIGGTLIGVGVAVMVAVPFAVKLGQEPGTRREKTLRR
jgi:membrane-associated phospholipid phosphatase